MQDLILVPLRKLYFYRMFWLLSGAMAILLIAVAAILSSLTHLNMGGVERSLQDFFVFPYVWQNASWLVRFSSYFFALLVILLITQDDENKLLRQHIMTGWSREEVLLSYLSVCLGFAFLLFAFVTIISLGFGRYDTSPYFNRDQLQILLCFFLQSFITFEFALLLSLLIRKAVPTVLAFVLWQMIIEPLSGWLLDRYFVRGISEVLPFHVIGRLIPEPYLPAVNLLQTSSVHTNIILLSAGYGLAFAIACWARLRFSDL